MVSTIKNESYRLEELPRGDSSNTKHYIGKNNNISINETSQESSVTKFNIFKGAFYTFMNSFLAQLISVIIKKISYVSICQFALVQYTGIFVISLPLTIFYSNKFLGEKSDWGFLFFKAFSGATALLFQFTAYRYLQLVQASIVMSTLPFVTAVLARIMIKESFDVVQTITLVITICGVLLSIRLPVILVKTYNFHFDVSYLIGYSTAFGYVLCFALSTVATRKLKETHSSIILMYTGFIGMIETAAVNTSMFSFVATNCGWDYILCSSIAIIGFGANWMATLAVQHEPAGLVAVQKSSFEILVNIVFQVIFFSYYPDWYVTAGAFLVLTSLTIIGIKKWVQMMPEASEKRHRLNWILS